MITFKKITFTLDTSALTGMIADNVKATMDDELPTFVEAVKRNVPSPDRQEIHIYATGAMQRSIKGAVDTTQPVAAMVISGDSRSAPYADEGYTRRGGIYSARSWRARGEQGHGGNSYMMQAVRPLLPGLAAKILERAKTQMET